MTSSTKQQVDKELAEIENRTKRAWCIYSESLKGLEGKDYETAEGRSWERLQKKLKDLDTRRKKVTTQTSTRPRKKSGQ